MSDIRKHIDMALGHYAAVDRAMSADDSADCEGQALVTTDVCLFWRCGRPQLELRGRYWCCPKCGGSYGEHALPNPSK